MAICVLSQEYQDELRELRAALLVVDLQNDFLAEGGLYCNENERPSRVRSSLAFDPRDGGGKRKAEGPYDPSRIHFVVENIKLLIKAARSAAVPIAYITAEYGPAYGIMNRRLLKNTRVSAPCRRPLGARVSLTLFATSSIPSPRNTTQLTRSSSANTRMTGF